MDLSNKKTWPRRLKGLSTDLEDYDLEMKEKEEKGFQCKSHCKRD